MVYLNPSGLQFLYKYVFIKAVSVFDGILNLIFSVRETGEQ